MKKTNKLLSLLLAALMLTAILPFSALAVPGSLPFRDVPEDAWYYPAVRRAYALGITKGTSPTTFEPDASVTREMFLVMLFRAAKIRLDMYEQPPNPEYPEETVYNFSDVPLGMWYSAAVGCAADMGVTNGVDDTHFGVGVPITREEMAAMAERFMTARAHVALRQAETPVEAFSDADQASPWAKDAVEAMRLSGILQGDSLHRLNPKSHATRAEAVAVILRLVDAAERVSFVPAETAWIRIMNAQNLQVQITDIKDPKTVQDIIRYLDNMPIDAEYGLTPQGGWIYSIDFFDQNDQYLTGGRFESHYIQVGHSTALVTTLPYLLPLTQMA